MEKKGQDKIFAHAQDDLNLRILRMFEGTVSFVAARNISALVVGTTSVMRQFETVFSLEIGNQN